MENEALRALVTDALFNGIEQKKRDELLKAALSSLLEEKRNSSFGTNKSDLQRAFDEALYTVARDIVKEHIIANPKMRNQIREVVVEAFDAVMKDEHRTELVSSIAGAIQEAFTPKQR